VHAADRALPWLLGATIGPAWGEDPATEAAGAICATGAGALARPLPNQRRRVVRDGSGAQRISLGDGGTAAGGAAEGGPEGGPDGAEEPLMARSSSSDIDSESLSAAVRKDKKDSFGVEERVSSTLEERRGQLRTICIAWRQQCRVGVFGMDTLAENANFCVFRHG
jgi:hypothetical protein